MALVVEPEKSGSTRAIIAASAQESTLGRDERGAILLLGLLMSAFLVTVIFQVANMGHAILWREVSQDAADSVAFETAVWNARGMNIIVALNIFMAVVMAILILWRLLMIVLGILAVLGLASCAIAWLIPFPFATLCAWGGLAVVGLQWMIAQDPIVSSNLYKVVVALHKGQVAVATATPVVGSVQASVRGTQDYDVNWAFGVGLQLIGATSSAGGSCTRTVNGQTSACPDTNVDQGQNCGMNGEPKACGVSCKTNDNSSIVENRLGLGPSLPVQESASWEVSTLCGKGAKMQQVLWNLLMGSLADSTGATFLRGLQSNDPTWEWLVSSISPFLCEDVQGVIEEKAQFAVDQMCQDAVNREACEKKANARLGKSNNRDKLGAVNSNDLRFAKVWWYAANGGLFMQSWGLVNADRTESERVDKLVGFANTVNGKGGEDNTKVDDSAWLVAGAEMYFNCSCGWSSCRDTAAWTMGWAARLRRVHEPWHYAADFVERFVVETAMNRLFDVLNRQSSGNGVFARIERELGERMNKLPGGRGEWSGFLGGIAFGTIVEGGTEEVWERGKAGLYKGGWIEDAVADWVGDGNESNVIH